MKALRLEPRQSLFATPECCCQFLTVVFEAAASAAEALWRRENARFRLKQFHVRRLNAHQNTTYTLANTEVACTQTRAPFEWLPLPFKSFAR